MKLPNFRRFNRGDYPTFQTSDGERFLDQLNEALETIITALQGQLSFSDNFNCELKTLKFSEDTSVDIRLTKLKGAVQDVRVMNPDLYDYVQVAWAPLSRSEVRVKVSFDSAPTEEIDVTLLFLGG